MSIRRIASLTLAVLALLAPAASRVAADIVVPPLEPGPLPVEAVKDLAYRDDPGADPVKHKLDLYLPRGQKGVPVLFFVHGGTWKSGDRKVYAKLGEVFASRGVAAAIISYRLSPQVQHPAHIQDVARAFAWTRDHVARYGGDPKRLVAMGHSAGAHLVALLATNEKYLKAEHCSLADLRGVVAVSGIYTIPPVGLAKVFGADPDGLKDASPAAHVTGRQPPFLVVYGDKDFPLFNLFGEQMARALRDAGSDAETLKADGRDHITIVTHLMKEDDATRRAVMAFVQKHADAR